MNIRKIYGNVIQILIGFACLMLKMNDCILLFCVHYIFSYFIYLYIMNAIIVLWIQHIHLNRIKLKFNILFSKLNLQSIYYNCNVGFCIYNLITNNNDAIIQYHYYNIIMVLIGSYYGILL